MTSRESLSIMSPNNRVAKAFSVVYQKFPPPWQTAGQLETARAQHDISLDKVPVIGRGILRAGAAFLNQRTSDPFLQHLGYILDRQIQLNLVKMNYVPSVRQFLLDRMVREPKNTIIIEEVPFVTRLQAGFTQGIDVVVPYSFLLDEDKDAVKLAQIAFIASMARDYLFDRNLVDPGNTLMARGGCAISKVIRFALDQDPRTSFPLTFGPFLKILVKTN